MLGLKVGKKHAQEVKEYLTRHKLMVVNYRVLGTEEFISFPIASAKSINRRFLRENEAEIVSLNFEKEGYRHDYSEDLKRSLGKAYNGSAHGYDIVGDIAVIDSTQNKAAGKKMASVIMDVNKNVKTVLAKGGPVSGVYRTRKYSYVAGKRKYDTIYRENGAAFAFDLRKTFFSTRLAFERMRLVNAAKDGENVLVMFAGVGPFAIEIAKKNKKSKIVGMELNRDAYRSMVENIKLNKTPNVTAECGDVKKLVSKHKTFADRIIMPLPWDSYRFLDSVLVAAKKRCIVHYYAFGDKENAFYFEAGRLRTYFKKHGRKFKVLFKRVARDYSHDQIEVVIDFLIY